MTEARVPSAAAAPPASTSPRRGPLVTTSEKTDDIRPRIASGVTAWLITERHTALTLSAAPATREQRRRRPERGTSPAARDGQAPHDHRDDDDAAEPARVVDPPRR